MDAGQFVLGGLGKAAELVNRSDSQVVYNGNTVITSGNDNKNLGAGVLEGGFNSLGPQIAQRNQQAIAQMSQQNGVWFLPAGTNVEIYVNQPTEL